MELFVIELSVAWWIQLKVDITYERDIDYDSSIKEVQRRYAERINPQWETATKRGRKIKRNDFLWDH